METHRRNRLCLDNLLLLVVLLIFFISGSHQLCKWTNENCNSGSECCSGDCEQAHVGTSARCQRSWLHEPCYADYHCVEYLKCGDNYQCCSPFWGVCAGRNDCCDPDHVCRPEEGFYYRRCLAPATNSALGSVLTLNCYVMLLCLMISGVLNVKL